MYIRSSLPVLREIERTFTLDWVSSTLEIVNGPKSTSDARTTPPITMPESLVAVDAALLGRGLAPGCRRLWRTIRSPLQLPCVNAGSLLRCVRPRLASCWGVRVGAAHEATPVVGHLLALLRCLGHLADLLPSRDGGSGVRLLWIRRCGGSECFTPQRLTLVKAEELAG